MRFEIPPHMKYALVHMFWNKSSNWAKKWFVAKRHTYVVIVKKAPPHHYTPIEHILHHSLSETLPQTILASDLTSPKLGSPKLDLSKIGPPKIGPPWTVEGRNDLRDAQLEWLNMEKADSRLEVKFTCRL